MNIIKLILHYNTPRETARLSQTVPDAIIVDNGSGDKFDKRIVMRFPDNRGFTKNWNRILRFMIDQKYGDAYWLMNSDIELGMAAQVRMHYLMMSEAYPMITPSFNCWMKQCRNQGTGDIRKIGCMEFTAPVIRRDVFERIGLFDERFTMGYGVDFDFCLRAKNAGIGLYCDDGSRFNHLKHRSILNIWKYKSHANEEMDRGMTEIYDSHWRDLVKEKLGVGGKL